MVGVKPQLVPGVDGSNQIEYHGKEYIVEIYLSQNCDQGRGVWETKDSRQDLLVVADRRDDFRFVDYQHR